MPDGIGVMRDEGPAESQGMEALASDKQRPGRTLTFCARASRHRGVR
jgi:hypothetical protein